MIAGLLKHVYVYRLFRLQRPHRLLDPILLTCFPASPQHQPAELQTLPVRHWFWRAIRFMLNLYP
jgi:hypothetical protein